MRLIELLTLTSMVASFEAAPIRRRHQAPASGTVQASNSGEHGRHHGHHQQNVDLQRRHQAASSSSSEHNGHHDHHQHHVDLQRRQSGAPQILNNHMSNTINIGAKPNFKKNKGALVDNVMANSINLGIDGNASGKKGKKGRDCSASKSRSRPSMIKSFMSNSINIGTSAQEDSDDDCGSGGGGLLDNYMANYINVGSLRNLVGGLYGGHDRDSNGDEDRDDGSDDDSDGEYRGRTKPIKSIDLSGKNNNIDSHHDNHSESEHTTKVNSKLPGNSDTHLRPESSMDSKSNESNQLQSVVKKPTEIKGDTEVNGVTKDNTKLPGNSGSFPPETAKDSSKGQNKESGANNEPEFGSTNTASPKLVNCKDCGKGSSDSGVPKPQDGKQSLETDVAKLIANGSTGSEASTDKESGNSMKKNKGYAETASGTPQPHKQNSYKDGNNNDSTKIESKKKNYAES